MQKRLNEKGHTITYREEGHGPTMILLHGYGGSPYEWDHLVPGLASKYRVIVPNLTQLFLDPYQRVRFNEQVDVLSGFIRRILKDGEQAHLLAASYGGALAWALSVHDPRTIGRLILLSPMPPNPSSRIRFPNLKRLLWLGQWPRLLWMFLNTGWGKRQLPDIATHFNVAWLKAKSKRLDEMSPRKVRLIVHVLHRFAWIVGRERWRYWEDRIRFIESPVCIIWGSEDRLYLESEPERLQQVFPACRLHRIHGAGHVLAKESPTQVEAIIESFFGAERKSA
ncbi:MAG TPA: alpha/beta hydrolase [Bdellovibrionales bacterium]|nr:alpha/beta hydrolase [Bdellovibrionales bacterium]